ncbi:MAG: nucleotidyltransferase domain-containing protein [Desulfobacteraceae bacterium]|nr:MAG: nucleotidyltransferase domain-containing protein [Desulfobacteraceae bacterium]
MAQRKPPQSVLNYISHLRKIYSDIKKVYMFGSYVKGSAGIDSDIDIAVVFKDVADPFDLQVQLMKIRRNYDSRIEPHVFRVADFEETYPLVAEIMKTGLELQ